MIKVRSTATAFMSLAMTTALIAPANAEEKYETGSTNVEPTSTHGDSVLLRDFNLSLEDQRYIDRVASIGENFHFNERGELALSLTDTDLIQEGFSNQEIANLRTGLSAANSSQAQQAGEASPRIHVDDGTLWISHGDLITGAATGVATAAGIGPAALSAALISLGTVMGGPVGTIITTVVALAGAPSMIELAGRITWAVATGQGVYIRPVLSYPPLEFGYW